MSQLPVISAPDAAAGGLVVPRLEVEVPDFNKVFIFLPIFGISFRTALYYNPWRVGRHPLQVSFFKIQTMKVNKY